MKQKRANTKATNNTSALIISTTQKKILSKQQITFNNQVKKIEKLRLDITRVAKSLNEKLGIYVKEIDPVKRQITALHKEEIPLLFAFYTNKKFLTKKQRKSLKELILGMLSEIFQSEGDESNEELKVIFKTLTGISYEKAAEEDFNMMKDEMESLFGDFGVKMNFDGMHSKMTPEEMMRKALEMQDSLKQSFHDQEQARKVRKKSKKELEREEKAKQLEEARAKNISSIYKQLAKILHPDLEQNEELKLQKEELMKQLTNAYENNDLHTLLNLELAWIQNQENNTGNLTDDKLGIYNEVLKEQVQELEAELVALQMHPRYEVLQEISMFPAEMKMQELNAQIVLVQQTKKILTMRIELLQSTEREALSTVKQILRDFEIEKTFEADFHDDFDDDDFFF